MHAVSTTFRKNIYKYCFLITFIYTCFFGIGILHPYTKHPPKLCSQRFRCSPFKLFKHFCIFLHKFHQHQSEKHRRMKKMISDTSTMYRINRTKQQETPSKINTYLQHHLYWWDPLRRLLLDDRDRLPTMDWFHYSCVNTEVCPSKDSSHDYRHWQVWRYSYLATHCSDKPFCSVLRCTLAMQSVLQTLQTTQHNFHYITVACRSTVSVQHVIITIRKRTRVCCKITKMLSKLSML